MELKEFIENMAGQFEETDASEITENCHFRELDEYSSLIGVGIIAMVHSEYDKAITGSDLRSCTTIKDLYDLIAKKQ